MAHSLDVLNRALDGVNAEFKMWAARVQIAKDALDQQVATLNEIRERRDNLEQAIAHLKDPPAPAQLREGVKVIDDTMSIKVAPVTGDAETVSPSKPPAPNLMDLVEPAQRVWTPPPAQARHPDDPEDFDIGGDPEDFDPMAKDNSPFPPLDISGKSESTSASVEPVSGSPPSNVGQSGQPDPKVGGRRSGR